MLKCVDIKKSWDYGFKVMPGEFADVCGRLSVRKTIDGDVFWWCTIDPNSGLISIERERCGSNIPSHCVYEDLDFLYDMIQEGIVVKEE